MNTHIGDQHIEGLINKSIANNDPYTPESPTSSSSSCSVLSGTITKRFDDEKTNREKLASLLKQKIQSGIPSNCKIKDIESIHNAELYDWAELNGAQYISSMDEAISTGSTTSTNVTPSPSKPAGPPIINDEQHSENQKEGIRNEGAETLSCVENSEVHEPAKVPSVAQNPLIVSYIASAHNKTTANIMKTSHQNNINDTSNIAAHNVFPRENVQIMYQQQNIAPSYYLQNNPYRNTILNGQQPMHNYMNAFNGMAGSILTGTLQPINNNINVVSPQPIYHNGYINNNDNNYRNNSMQYNNIPTRAKVKVNQIKCEYIHNPPPKTAEDYHWLCYYYRSDNKYSCTFGNKCKYRHYNFEIRADMRTQCNPSKPIYRPTPKQLMKAGKLMKSLQKRYQWLMGNASMLLTENRRLEKKYEPMEKAEEIDNIRMKLKAEQHQDADDVEIEENVAGFEKMVFKFEENDMKDLRRKLSTLVPLISDKEKNKKDLERIRMKICSLVQTLCDFQKKIDEMT